MECRAYPNSIWSTCPCPRHRKIKRRSSKAWEAGLMTWPTPEEAWAAVDTMLARGLSLREIARAAGLNWQSMTSRNAERSRGIVRRLQPRTRAALVKAEQDTRDVTPRQMPEAGARRRLQALALIGWTCREIQQRTGLGYMTLQNIRMGRYTYVSRDTHQRICAIYDELSDTPGPNDNARRCAERHGWAPAIAWDDDTIDDPDAEPQHLAGAPDPTEHLTNEERAARKALVFIEDVEYMHSTGRSLALIAAKYGITPKGVLRRLERHGAGALAHALTGWDAGNQHDEEQEAS